MKRKLIVFALYGVFFAAACDQAGPLEPTAAVEGEASATPEQSIEQLLAKGPVVEVPAGSVDALADAIEAAGVGGVVLLKAGIHEESAPVEIGHRVAIVGEAGAKLILDTHPGIATQVMEAALYIHNADDVIVHGLEIRPKGTIGGTAIFIEDADRTIVRRNMIHDHEVSVLVHKGDHATIENNTIVASGGWLTGDISAADGVIIMNGTFARVNGNTISNAVLGLFASDGRGVASDNVLTGNFIGIILCNVPAAIPTPGGEIVGSENPAFEWTVRGNRTTDNFDIGILAIDGAHDNHIVNNIGGNNGRYDVELAGDSQRFGFFTPTSYNNKVNAGRDTDAIIKDCGVNDQVNGGVLVDTGADPCS